MFLDNVDSEEDGCSDVEDDCVTQIEDSLLDGSVIQTTSIQNNPKMNELVCSKYVLIFSSHFRL